MLTDSINGGAKHDRILWQFFNWLIKIENKSMNLNLLQRIRAKSESYTLLKIYNGIFVTQT